MRENIALFGAGGKMGARACQRNCLLISIQK